MDSLFTDPAQQRKLTPLAERMRPVSLSEVVGQPKLVQVLRDLMQRTALPSLILWGPPGCGKTTIARLLAGERYEFIAMSAVLAGVRDVRRIVAEAGERRKTDNRGTLFFLDEIHRFNKAQQDVLLPHVEKGTIVLVGATTENPSFEVIGPLLSRCRVLTLDALKAEEIEVLLSRALIDDERGLGLSEDAADPVVLRQMAQLAAGDARFALNTLEVCAALIAEQIDPVAAGPRPAVDAQDAGVGDPGLPSGERPSRLITTEVLKRALAGGARRALLYDKAGEEHFNLISALHKSIRGCDPDAALYYLARMLEAGEDPKYVVRRLVRAASEDIGLADPWALVHAVAVKDAVEFIGIPECNNALAQLVVYLACAPKSNAMYLAYAKAAEAAKEHGALPPPLRIRNAPTRLMQELGYGEGYEYGHAHPGGFVPQDYWPEELRESPPRLLNLKGVGAEKTLIERLRKWWGHRFERGEGEESNPGSASVPARDPYGTTSTGSASVPARAEAELRQGRRKLPHWQLAGSAYLITWRIHEGQPPLRDEERDIVLDALKHFSQERYRLYAYVVMDNHVHVVCQPLEGWEVGKIVHSWKSFAANRLQRDAGRQGQLWQHDYHDRIIRSESDLLEKCEYVLANPQRRWTDVTQYRWAGFEG